MFFASLCYAEDETPAAYASVDGGVTNAQFRLSAKPILQFVDGKAVMTLGEGTTHVAELPMAYGARLEVQFGNYDEATNHQPTTITDAGYGTIFSAFQIVVPSEGVEVYGPSYDADAKKLNANALTKLSPGTIIPVSTGVLIKNTGNYNLSFASTETPSIVATALTGSVMSVPSSIFNGQIYSLAKEEGITAFYKYVGAKTVAGKAFLVVGNTSAKRVMIDCGNMSTTITELEVAEGNNSYFNAMGQKVNPSKKGLVITKNKKYINK